MTFVPLQRPKSSRVHRSEYIIGTVSKAGIQGYVREMNIFLKKNP